MSSKKAATKVRVAAAETTEALDSTGRQRQLKRDEVGFVVLAPLVFLQPS
jgi:hypothetical protein